MTLQVIYDAAGRVLQWQDTDKFSYADPEDGVSVIKVTSKQWANQSSLKWVRDGKLTDIAPTDEMTEVEKLADAARVKRNRLLKFSDWTQVPDAPVNQQDWATYRQALRDITLQDGFPENINWPTEP